MSTFGDRLLEAIGPGGYDVSMRRSIQTVVLYEANRCLAEKLKSLRPFQRKIALFDMATHLVSTLPLPAHVKEEVMYRTATSKEPLNGDAAWKRMKLIDREFDKIIEGIRPFLTDHTFDEACDLYIQAQYEEVSKNKGKPHPRHWEHSHNNVWLAYRMYYRGETLDPNLPRAKPPKQIVVPAQKPKSGMNPYYLSVDDSAKASIAPKPAIPEKDSDINEVELEAIVNQGDAEAILESNKGDERRLVLREVREHVDLLKEFEGVIPQDELNKRKRELFLALPPAPPPATPGTPGGGKKKARTGDMEPTAEAAV